jgi:hypothetical protein
MMWNSFPRPGLLPGFLLVAFACSSGTVIAQTDDSVWINAGIRSAISAGENSYTIPAGVHRLATPIVLPEGVLNFTLRGAGSGETHLLATALMSEAIRLGVGGVEFMVYDDLARGAIDKPVAEGGKHLVLERGGPLLSTGDYVLWGDAVIRHKTVALDARYEGELVTVVSRRPGTRTLTLEQGVGREFRAGSKLSPVANLSRNVTVQGISFDGNGLAGAMVHAHLMRGLVLRDLKATRFDRGALEVYLCRDVVIEDCRVSFPSNTFDGRGYGYAINGSRFVQVRGSQAYETRHAVTVARGSTDVAIHNLYAEHTNAWWGGISLHGSDERRVTISDTTTTTIDFGNPSWLGGMATARVLNCTVNSLRYRPNAKDVGVRNSQIVTILFDDYDGLGNPSPVPEATSIHDLWFEDSTFRSHGLIIGNRHINIGRLAFRNCAFVGLKPNIQLFHFITAVGDVSFANCTFSLQGFYDPIVLSTGAAGSLKFTMSDCLVQSTESLRQAILVDGTYVGSLDIQKNMLLSDHPSAVFVQNNTDAPAVVTDNVVEAPPSG